MRCIQDTEYALHGSHEKSANAFYNKMNQRFYCSPEGNQTLILGTGNLHSIR